VKAHAVKDCLRELQELSEYTAAQPVDVEPPEDEVEEVEEVVVPPDVEEVVEVVEVVDPPDEVVPLDEVEAGQELIG